MSVLTYKVWDWEGKLVMTTSRQNEAFVKARQVSGHVDTICPDCGMVILPNHSCLDC